MVRQNVQTTANGLKNNKMYIDYYRLFSFSCPTPTAAAVEQVKWAVVRCCKCFCFG